MLKLRSGEHQLPLFEGEDEAEVELGEEVSGKSSFREPNTNHQAPSKFMDIKSQSTTTLQKYTL